ncbi:MAG: Rieske (2Fe-2S) protein [Gammaproteobacteria bacterium]
MTDPYIPVIPISDLPVSGVLCTTAAGTPIVLCKVGDEIHAVSNECTHANTSFEGGRLRRFRLICPLHGAMFDVRTGEPNGQLARGPLTVYPARISDEGVIEVNVAETD